MLSELEFLTNLPGARISAFLIILIGTSIISQLALTALLRIIRFLAGKTETTLDDRLLGAVSPYLPVIAVVISIWFSISQIYPGQNIQGMDEFELLVIALLAVVGLMIGSIADALLVWYGIEIRAENKKVNEKDVFPFVRNVIRIGISAIFIVFILQRLGFDTTAIITGLGVGGIAVALALQDTLGNFFGGVHILVDKPFKEEDYIKTDTGFEGQVKQIGWRTTKIETFPNRNLIIVPNSKIANAVLENFSYPEQDTGVSYTIGVDYKEDVQKVEQVILDAIKQVAKTNNAINQESIWVRFDTFGDFSLNFKFGFLVKGWQNRAIALAAVNREIFYEFKKNRINIPFPVRTIYNVNTNEKNEDKTRENKTKKQYS